MYAQVWRTRLWMIRFGTFAVGTTFFTDGTSGWTQQCASQMWPAQEAMIAEQEAVEVFDEPVDEDIDAGEW